MTDNRKGSELRLRTKRFALEIIRLVNTLPKDLVSQAIARQLVRSGTSVGANVRAASLAKSDADMVSKFKTVEEEADETAYWLELLHESGAIESERIDLLHREAEEIRLIVSASIKTIRSRG